MTMCDDEPIDLNAVRADDALLDAIARGDAEPDELGEILAALAATAVVTHLLSGRADLTKCCRRSANALPKGDHVTDEEALCTCPEMRP